MVVRSVNMGLEKEDKMEEMDLGEKEDDEEENKRKKKRQREINILNKMLDDPEIAHWLTKAIDYYEIHGSSKGLVVTVITPDIDKNDNNNNNSQKVVSNKEDGAAASKKDDNKKNSVGPIKNNSIVPLEMEERHSNTIGANHKSGTMDTTNTVLRPPPKNSETSTIVVVNNGEKKTGETKRLVSRSLSTFSDIATRTSSRLTGILADDDDNNFDTGMAANADDIEEELQVFFHATQQKVIMI